MSRALGFFLAVAIFASGCGEYNFVHIFPFEGGIYERSVPVAGISGRECKMSIEEFESLKSRAGGYFKEWRVLLDGEEFHSEGIAIGEKHYGDSGGEAWFSAREDLQVDGLTPVAMFFTRAEMLIFFLAEDGVM